MPVWIFQMSYNGGEWQTVDDNLFIDELYRYHDILSPYMKEMIHGSELCRENKRFRILSE